MPREKSEEAQWWYQAVYSAIQQIPHGKVTSYGHIALLLDFPKRARQVGVCLKHLPTFDSANPDQFFFHDQNVPWQRVVNSKGGISPRGDDGSAANRQAERLRAEGVEVNPARGIEEMTVDFGKYGWFPSKLPDEESEDDTQSQHNGHLLRPWQDYDDSTVSPLIVAIHGGTYSSQYFDALPEYSAGPISGITGVPFVAIDRPGYRESSTLPAVPAGSTFAQEEGKYLHRYILPKIWEEYGVPSGASTIVVMGHSLGCSPCVVAAALYSQEAEPQYPWAGVILSGRGMVSAFTKSQSEEQLARGKALGYVEFPPGAKDFLMFGDSKLGLASAEIRRVSEEITHRAPFGEFEDRRLHWDHYWKSYAEQVKMPVVAAIGGRDSLFRASQQDIEEFASAFSNAPKVEAVLVANAPHCLELSYWGPAWLLRCFGFAIECATSTALQPDGGELETLRRL